MPDNLQILKHKKESIDKARKIANMPPLKKEKEYNDFLLEAKKKKSP